MNRRNVHLVEFLSMIASRRHWCTGWIVLVAMAFGQPTFGGITDEEEAKPSVSAVPTLPSERGGQESIGQQWPDLDLEFIERNDAVPLDSGESVPVVTLYRWWTNGCPFCEKSLPAIEEWRRRFESQGLRTVAVFHPKPPREIAPSFIERTAAAMGYTGDLAIDAGWSQFRRATAEWQNRRATSVSFLVDHEGIIRFVHPGPDFFPSDESQYQRQDEDHALLETAIETLLKSLPDSATDESDAAVNATP